MKEDKSQIYIHDLEHRIVDLEARLRFYERIIAKIEFDEELSTGQFVTLLQILERYKKHSIKKVSRR